MPALDLAALRALLSRHFRVYDAQEDKMRGQVVARRFYIMFPPSEFEPRYAAARAELAQADPNLIAFLRREGGEDVLFVAERPPDRPQSVPLRVVLLLATIVTTTTAGALAWHTYLHGGEGVGWSVLWDPQDLLWGFVTFALPLMLILGIHETAHFVVARRHGLRATLPMFIPAPPFPFFIGTFGAFISLKDPLPDRRALFDVGAAGPLAGFAVALPVVVLGIFLTSHPFLDDRPGLAVPDIGRPLADLDIPYTLDGNESGVAVLRVDGPRPGPAVLNLTAPGGRGDWAYALRATVTLANGTVLREDQAGTLPPGQAALRTLAIPANATRAEVRIAWDDGLMHFGDPLLVQAFNLLSRLLFGDDDQEYLTHPTYMAGWVGLLVTGLNLLPTGQLDGGHVSRAVFGENARHVARLTLGTILVFALWFDSGLGGEGRGTIFTFLALFILITGLHHPPPLNDRTRLDRRRVALAAVVLAVFALTFVPVPFQL